ncbi:hypothetical protein [Mongoliitalea lutea]|uniref:Uncharacterized protein n=1 Tax=Mongoliitalea lutea TaxID=849756 RepID=A0A8J3CWM3_9BACT|nr:hypothetical protein [Mongoliitalea lutea]GHB35417.1 hypothetical protein GCM10008106_16090 [Mongoliitalea lutea]
MLKLIYCSIYFSFIAFLFIYLPYPQEVIDASQFDFQQNMFANEMIKPIRAGFPLKIDELKINLFSFQESGKMFHVIFISSFPQFSPILIYVVVGVLIGSLLTLLLGYRVMLDMKELKGNKELLEYDLWKVKNEALKKERVLKRKIIDLELKIEQNLHNQGGESIALKTQVPTSENP